MQPAGHATASPPSHDLFLGYRIERQGEVWIAYGPHRLKSLINIGPTRSGKTRDLLGYILAGYGGTIDGVTPSTIWNDSKGELCSIGARARCLLDDRVYKIDPFGTVADSHWVVNARLNVLDGMTPASKTFTSDIKTLAESLIIVEGNSPHWSNRARQLVTCCLANMCDDSNQEPACLPYLMTILGLPGASFKAYMERLAHSPLRMVRDLAGAFAADTDEVRSVISTAIGQLDFLQDDAIADVLGGPSSFRLSDLKQGGMSLFFCMPEAKRAAFSRFTRLLWARTLKALYKPPFAPVLCVMDEIANSLSGTSMVLFEHAFSLGAGSGLRIFALFQSLPQLRDLFKAQSDAVMSSAGVLQFFRPNDPVTTEYISKRAGRRTLSLLEESTSFSENSGENGQGSSGSSTSFSWKHYDRPRWTDQQLYEMSPQRQVLFVEGIGAPVVAWRKPYWESGYADRLDDNPMYAPGR